MGKITVSNEEFRTVRDAMRELNRMVDALDRGEETKFVLTHRNRMRAVVVSVDTFSAMQQQLGGAPQPEGA
jgi:PHD/YefM family antitoxin component YafN of YafNO toxin-antitoxin module